MSLNINLAKVKETVVDRYLSLYGIPVKGKLNAKVNALETYQLKNTPETDLSTPCTECGGASNVDLPECCYCGTADTDIPTSVAAVASATSVETASTEPPPPVAVAASTQVGAVTVEAEPVKPKRKGLVSARASKPKSNGHSAEVVEAHQGELSVTKELDDAVGRVIAAMKSGATSYWDLGRALFDIFSKQLWKQRIEAGKQKFPSWNLFCRDELGMSHVNTFSIMDAAMATEREDFEAIGHTKMRLLLQLPKARSQELLEQAKKGKLSRAQLRKIISDEVPKGEVRETGRRNTRAAAAASPQVRASRREPKPDGEITAVSQLGRTKVKLFARPNPKKPGKPVRAMSLTQDPWGEETLVNGVVVRYAVVKSATGIELIIERRRE